MSSISCSAMRILPVLLLAWTSAISADTTQVAGRPTPSLVLRRSAAPGQNSIPLVALTAHRDSAATARPYSISAQVSPGPELNRSGAHLEGTPVWNWDSPYSQGTGNWSRSYAENSMQGHEDPARPRRNWIFGLH